MLNYRLKTFLMLAQTLSYTKTAEILHMTQPAVSQHIRYLEETYGIKLFEYNNRKLQMTQMGKKFYQKVTELEVQCQTIINDLKVEGTSKQKLCFDATITFGEYILPDLLCEWLKDGSIELCMRIKRTNECLEALDEGKIDFALVEGFFDKAIYGNYIIKKTHMGLVVGNNHPLTKLDTVKLNDILDYTLIVRQKESHMRGILPTGLAEHNLSYESFKGLIQCGSMNVMKKLIKKGCGIGFLHEDAIKEDVRDGSLVELKVLDFELHRELNMVFLKNTNHQRIIQKVYHDLVNYCNSK